MRKIRLSDTDLELFDIEISPGDYMFFQRHKDAFKTMFREQGKPFWTRFAITFRSFTVKHGIIKQMNIDSPKFQNLIDQAFIFIHEQFVDGKQNMAKNFLEDIARLAQNQDRFPELDSKSFSKDPFYIRETRELFRNFFGTPDQKSSYLKVYILSPVYLRFGGSICRCLIRWTEAQQMDPKDESYWIPPQPQTETQSGNAEAAETIMCSSCIDFCGTIYFKEKIMGYRGGPVSFCFWRKGDPRFNDPNNPLYAPHLSKDDDWRDLLTIDMFRDFFNYVRYTYGSESDKCDECQDLKKKRDKVIHVCRASKKKKKKPAKEKEELIKDLKEVERKEKLEKLHKAALKQKSSEYQVNKIQLDGDSKDLVQSNSLVKTVKRSDFSTEEEFRENTMFKMPDGYDPNDPEPLVLGVKKDGSLVLDYRRNYVLVSGFKVIKMEDKAHGLYEVNISPTSDRTDEMENEHFEKMRLKMEEKDLNWFRLNSQFLKEQIPGLPERFEWWEARGFVVCVFDYEVEEKEQCEKWTKFSIKVSGYEEMLVKHAVMLLVHYIAKHKLQSCPGWNMEIDDIVACLLPERQPNIEDIQVSLMRGFRFEDRLTYEEKASLIKHYPTLNFSKILMGVDKGLAKTLLDSEDDAEKMKMRKMIDAVAEKNLLTKNLPVIDVAELKTKLGLDGEPTKADILYEQMMQDPANFEFFTLADIDEEEGYWDLGLKSLEIRCYNRLFDPPVEVCPMCKQVGVPCECFKPDILDEKVKNFFHKQAGYYINFDARGKDKRVELPKLQYHESKLSLDDDHVEPPMKEHDIRKELAKVTDKCVELGLNVADYEVTTQTDLPSSLGGEANMDPLPGCHCSLSFRIASGKKYQTISITVGAYMSEDKILYNAEVKRIQALQEGNMCCCARSQLEEEIKQIEAKRMEKKRSVKGKVQEQKAIEGPGNTEVMHKIPEMNDENVKTEVDNKIDKNEKEKDVEKLDEKVEKIEVDGEDGVQKIELSEESKVDEKSAVEEKLEAGNVNEEIAESPEKEQKIDSEIDSKPNEANVESIVTLEKKSEILENENEQAFKHEESEKNTENNVTTEKTEGKEEKPANTELEGAVAGASNMDNVDAKVENEEPADDLTLEQFCDLMKMNFEDGIAAYAKMNIKKPIKFRRRENNCNADRIVELMQKSYDQADREERKKLENPQWSVNHVPVVNKDTKKEMFAVNTVNIGKTTIMFTTDTKKAEPKHEVKEKKKIKKQKVAKLPKRKTIQDEYERAKNKGQMEDVEKLDRQRMSMLQLFGDLAGDEKIGEQISDALMKVGRHYTEEESEEGKRRMFSEMKMDKDGNYFMDEKSLKRIFDPRDIDALKGITEEFSDVIKGREYKLQDMANNLKYQLGQEFGPELMNDAKVEKKPEEKPRKKKLKKKKPPPMEDVAKGEEFQLRDCGHCNKKEPTRKAFKKCQMCKDEGVLEVRYYCCRECQVEDWKNRHKMEHRDCLLG
ncbi:uncharacterized protein LOC128216891 isoform X2 [Mya arenaria]|uniref:uncharacterized protein LOC128216891 isoform X2 n=1 Tax=Mya arenaria TaxID=6604 RepID=UPI0022E87FBA|nr:uncharacterized protein LOC128216891 isoform X2 [Mya arenaria]